ncbi:hypothetical protein [Alteribacillus bidgolensis]|uniref:Uncharacterized protein n=1 Tax=Alteribacillus bidgolensis TaxID=930129 RepID=A0A1G8I7A0_9BACI|nr:hypothetical protein [Alteribacillus bidgolensis]SDI14845.1 hypothetical protein SAMN05216352_10570 [Alteribacillus bidgolensis]
MKYLSHKPTLYLFTLALFFIMLAACSEGGGESVTDADEVTGATGVASEGETGGAEESEEIEVR